MTIPKYEQILNWDIEERDGKKFVNAYWTEEEFKMVNGDLEYPPVLTKTYELNALIANGYYMTLGTS